LKGLEKLLHSVQISVALITVCVRARTYVRQERYVSTLYSRVFRTNIFGSFFSSYMYVEKAVETDVCMKNPRI